MNTETQSPRLIGSSVLLAGLSAMTVINLKHSEDEYINVTHAGPAENGKYLGWITTLEGRPVINTEPIFDTPADAEAHMRRVIAAARGWENPANDKLRHRHPAETSANKESEQ